MDNIGAVSQELAEIVALEILPIPDNVLLDTATHDYLDRRAIDFNETRLQAQKSIGILKFIGNNSTIIPVGTLVSYYNLRFETLEEGIIQDSFVMINSQCTTAGLVGNINAYSIDSINNIENNLINTIIGVDGVSNPDDFMGGTEDETDESFRSRILDKIQKPITSGNVYHYEYWAKQVAGVGSAKVVPCWAGAGTVKVIILSSEGDVPDDLIIQNVADFIQENRPIGADVTVVEAEPISIVIHSELELNINYSIDTITQNIKIAIQNYLNSIAFDDTKILSYYKIGDIIFDVDGVSDIISYTINGEISSIKPEFDGFFKLDEVIINGT